MDKHEPARMRAVVVINFMISRGRAALERFTAEKRQARLFIGSTAEERYDGVNDHDGETSVANKMHRPRCARRNRRSTP